MILQLTGFSFPNIVAILLLPIFIFPGFAGLKLRLYTARRTDSYGRLDTAVYSWTIGSVSIFLLYFAVFIETGDISLIPEFLIETVGKSNPNQEATTTLHLEKVALAYLVHVFLSCGIGLVYGVIAYNFLDDVRVINSSTNKEYMVNRIAPGRRIDVRTRSGEIIRGKTPQRHDNKDDEGLLLLSPQRLADNPGGDIIGEHEIGETIFIDADKISRISVIDDEEPENLDPEQTYEDPDRLQSFFSELVSGVTPNKPLSHLLSPPRFVLAITMKYLAAILVSFGLLQYIYGPVDLGVLTITFVLAIACGILSVTAFIHAIFSEVVRSWVKIYLLVVSLVLFAHSIIYQGVYPRSLFFVVLLGSLIGGLIIGLVWVYATTWKRGFSGHATVFFTIGSLILTASVVTDTSSWFLTGGNAAIMWILSLITLFIAMIQGGPSRRQPWSEKLQSPLVILLTITYVIALISTPWMFMGYSILPLWNMMYPFIFGFMPIISGYIYDSQLKSEQVKDRYK